MAARYAIPDEPSPSGLAHLVVHPMWPLFAQMLIGSWLALPWFVLNGLALGSPTRTREWASVAGSLFGSGALLMVLAFAANSAVLADTGLRLSLLSVVALKISLAYALYLMQSRSFELWQHFGGHARNGGWVLFAGFLLDRPLFDLLGMDGLLRMVVD